MSHTRCAQKVGFQHISPWYLGNNTYSGWCGNYTPYESEKISPGTYWLHHVSLISYPLKSCPRLLSPLKHFPTTFPLSVPQIFLVVYSSILNTEAAGFSEKLGGFYKTTQRHIHQDSTLHIHCRVSPIFCKISNRGCCRSILQIIPNVYKIKSFQCLLPDSKCGPRVKLIIHLHLIV